MQQKSAEELAYWLYENHPQIFTALNTNAVAEASNLAGIADVLSTIGSSVSSAVKNVGSYLTSQQGIDTLAKLGGTYLASAQQTKVMQTQIALAQANQPPASIVNVPGANGQPVAVYTPFNQPVTAGLLSALQPSFLQQYALPLTVAGGALALLFFIRR